jgi:hypothetical protein
MSSALQKINARVKVLKKKHPNSKHTTLQKQAGKEYKAGKLGGVKHSHKRKKKVGAHTHRKKKSVGTHHRRVGTLRGKSHQDGVDRKKVDITIGSVSSHKAAIKKKLIHEIGVEEGRKLTAKSARVRKKIQKRITEKKAEFRKFM